MKERPKHKIYAVEYSPSGDCLETKPLEDALRENRISAIAHAKTSEELKRHLGVMVFIGWHKTVAERFAKDFGAYLERSKGGGDGFKGIES
jgi:hypothetical protein